MNIVCILLKETIKKDCFCKISRSVATKKQIRKSDASERHFKAEYYIAANSKADMILLLQKEQQNINLFSRRDHSTVYLLHESKKLWSIQGMHLFVTIDWQRKAFSAIVKTGIATKKDMCLHFLRIHSPKWFSHFKIKLALFRKVSATFKYIFTVQDSSLLPKKLHLGHFITVMS